MASPVGHAAYNKNGEGGRPKKWTDIRLDEEADALDIWSDADQNNIFVQDFCLSRGFSDHKVAEWARTHERFRNAYHRLLTKQKTMLFKGGLTKRYSYPMCALLLSTYHNIHMKTEQVISTEVGTKTLIDEIADQTKDIIDITDNVKELADESRGVGQEASGPILEAEQPISDSGQEGSPDTV